MEMDKGVPLAGTLGVELDFVVVSVTLQRAIDEIDDIMDQAFAPEAGSLDGTDWPV